MHQASAGRSESAQRNLARLRRRRVLRWLAREGAQEEFLPRVDDVVGGFTLVERLGAGSYGTVFRARRGEGVFAVKFLYLPQVGPWASRELEVLLRLHHVGLVVVEGHGHHGHFPGFGPLFLYIVTGYVPGLPMGERVERDNPTAHWVGRAVLALAAQLVVAHSVDVVHRDIKCDNVVVREEDGEPVLVDYGVGTYPGALEVTGGMLPGNPWHRAPEAWRFRRERQPGERYEASARDDLWALGVLFYWLLTGTWPFEGETEEEVEDAVLHTVPVPAHVRNPRVPEALSAVCARMLEKAPEARYPDAKEMAEALVAALAGVDAGGEVPLCEAWAPDNATTRSDEVLGMEAVAVDLEAADARYRRVSAYERERPRRGRPVTPEAQGSESPLLEAEPLVGGGEAPVPPAPEPPRAVSPPAREWWRRTWVLGAVALLAAVSPHTVSSLVPPPSTSAAVPMSCATPASWGVWASFGQEMATPWCPLEGGGGAAPAWAPTPAPVAFATHSEDSSRVKTPRKDSNQQEKDQQKGGQGLKAVANALCTVTVGMTAAGCHGAQVRAAPAPEACPAGSLEVMKQLGIRTGDEAGTDFPGVGREEIRVTVREGPGAQLILGEHLGKLEAGTVLTGKLLFGKERVYGRFTEARRPGGETFRVCLEAWDVWQGALVRGLVREPDGGGPDTAKVIAFPHVKAVERFE